MFQLCFPLQEPPTHVFVPTTTGYRLMKYRYVCRGAHALHCQWNTTEQHHQLPSLHFPLMSFIWGKLSGEWITEIKRLKTQLDFHSSWEVINIWISCHWELISFSSGQVLFCVPATVFVNSIRLGCCCEYGRYTAECEELCVERACAVH